jgi:hypothetical protein
MLADAILRPLKRLLRRGLSPAGFQVVRTSTLPLRCVPRYQSEFPASLSNGGMEGVESWLPLMWIDQTEFNADQPISIRFALTATRPGRVLFARPVNCLKRISGENIAALLSAPLYL